MSSNVEIPEQIITGNICPCDPDGKGKYFIPQKKICDTANDFKIDSISKDVWSIKNGKVYVSWTTFYKLPEPLQTHWKNVELKDGKGYGIKTGNQQDGRFLIVFDCDNDNKKPGNMLIFL